MSKISSSLEVNDSAEVSRVPGTPVPAEVKMYQLFYHWNRMGPHTQIKNFASTESDFQKVIQRGRRHCEFMGYRFIRVSPLISDLSEDERQFSDREDPPHLRG